MLVTISFSGLDRMDNLLKCHSRPHSTFLRIVCKTLAHQECAEAPVAQSERPIVVRVELNRLGGIASHVDQDVLGEDQMHTACWNSWTSNPSAREKRLRLSDASLQAGYTHSLRQHEDSRGSDTGWRGAAEDAGVLRIGELLPVCQQVRTSGQGNDRGEVEGLVGYARRNFLVPVPHLASWEELNARLEAECPQAAGVKAARLAEGHRVRFITAAALASGLLEARDEKELLRSQKLLASYQLLIVDELGFVPLSKTGAELLFEAFSQRYERSSTLVTSNLPFQEWTKIFGSKRLTGALLDRLSHHVHILKMNGGSYRLKQSYTNRNPSPPPRESQPYRPNARGTLLQEKRY